MSGVALTLGPESTLTKEQAQHLRYSSDETRSLHWLSLLTACFVIGNTVLAGRYPAFLPVAFVANAFSSVRYSGYIHALNHAYKLNERVPWLLELLPAAWSPFILGFSETQRIHLTHHRFETGPGDPDNFVIAGKSKLLIFVKCAFIFEHWFFYAIRHRWLTPRFWPAYLVRLAIFASVFYFAGPKAALLVFVLAVKVGTAGSFFVFSYLGHVSEGQRGNYILPLPTPLVWLSRSLIGRYAADPAGYHAVHHARPWVSGARLDEALVLLTAKRELGSELAQHA